MQIKILPDTKKAFEDCFDGHRFQSSTKSVTASEPADGVEGLRLSVLLN